MSIEGEQHICCNINERNKRKVTESRTNLHPMKEFRLIFDRFFCFYSRKMLPLNLCFHVCLTSECHRMRVQIICLIVLRAKLVIGFITQCSAMRVTRKITVTHLEYHIDLLSFCCEDKFLFWQRRVKGDRRQHSVAWIWFLIDEKTSIHPTVHLLYPINLIQGWGGGWNLSQLALGERQGKW